MSRLRRTAVYIALRETVGHDLIFRHYTNKVVVGKYAETKMKSFPEQNGSKMEKKIQQNNKPSA